LLAAFFLDILSCLRYNIHMKDLTTSEAAAITGIPVETVRRYINRGIIRAYKRGRDWFISRPEIEQFQNSRRKRGRPKKEQ
jgi:excisionase family DNA binding protein